MTLNSIFNTSLRFRRHNCQNCKWRCQIPLARKAHVADGLLDVVCFDVSRRRELEKWLDAPQDEPAPVTARQGKIVELTWADVANRVDDETYGNRDTKQVAELACEKEQAKILIPVKHPSQKAIAK